MHAMKSINTYQSTREHINTYSTCTVCSLYVRYVLSYMLSVIGWIRGLSLSSMLKTVCLLGLSLAWIGNHVLYVQSVQGCAEPTLPCVAKPHSTHRHTANAAGHTASTGKNHIVIPARIISNATWSSDRKSIATGRNMMRYDNMIGYEATYHHSRGETHRVKCTAHLEFRCSCPTYACDSYVATFSSYPVNGQCLSRELRLCSYISMYVAWCMSIGQNGMRSRLAGGLRSDAAGGVVAPPLGQICVRVQGSGDGWVCEGAHNSNTHKPHKLHRTWAC